MDDSSIPVFFFFFQRTKNRCLFNYGIFFSKKPELTFFFFHSKFFFPENLRIGTSLKIQRTAQHGVKTPEIHLNITNISEGSLSPNPNLTWVYFFSTLNLSPNLSVLYKLGLVTCLFANGMLMNIIIIIRDSVH